METENEGQIKESSKQVVIPPNAQIYIDMNGLYDMREIWSVLY